MKIILIRHGESTSDTENRYGGSFDDHLTSKGRNQAAKLAEKISRKGIEAIYTSNLLRAMETAQILGKKLDRHVNQLESVRERNSYGHLTGMKKDEAKAKFPKDVELLNKYTNTVAGGELYETFKARILFSLDNLTKTSHSSIAIVTHGGPIACIFRELLKLGEFKNIGDCAFFEIIYDGKYKLMTIENADLEKPVKLPK